MKKRDFAGAAQQATVFLKKTTNCLSGKPSIEDGKGRINPKVS
jgi:hypothetical protein